MNLAIIPARGASKRIPRKNIRNFSGRPMIAWSIEAAREAGCFERIIVSTDDREIAEVAESYGAEVPFIRPADLSDDHTPTIPVIRHAIDQLEAEGCRPDYICCLYATAPFVTAELLRQGLADLRANPDTEFVFSATEFNFPIWRSLKLKPSGTATMNWPEHEMTRSQDLPPAYHDAGQFYWGTPEAYQKNEGIFSAKCRLCLVPSYRVQDIDTEDDWRRAELAFQALKTKETS
ncbi:pseudaminic acid cytidylyltransferase [Coraliomargarita sinensis]|uniref:Pseudaminic acid cytidylyltransferase n=1 Tax=Coraliomargarita sinensis TaxID=2174842 RepID=A0A317ZQ66_9BACT|nr:pseudaminic acid cytidylyltransferase [Coraliomargarita sinensis]PXA05561.1 pseudaminic acid cytidylyltransferase [Coraliomargarita sinensis]